MNRSRFSLLVPWLCAVVLVACGSTAPSPEPSPSPIAPLLGGTLKATFGLATFESFQVDDQAHTNWTWDPQRNWAQEPFELDRCCLLRTLMAYNGRSTRDGGAILRPDLASDYPSISSDGLTWTFKIKPGLHYAPPMADKSIVSGDFVRSLERALRPDPFADPPNSTTFTPYGFYLSDVIAGAHEFGAGTVSSISGLETPDDQTLVIHLTKPAGDLGARLAMPAFAPIPPAAADGHDTGYGRYLVASGPYMMEGADQLQPNLPADQQPTVSGYVPGQHLFLVRNPSWDRTTDDLRNAYADRIEIYDDDAYSTQLESLKSNQVDVSLDSDLDPGDETGLLADPATTQRVRVAPTLATEWILLNLAVPPFDDIHVRRAIQLVTNKKALINILEPDLTVAHHAIPDAFENGLLSNYDPYATNGDAGDLNRAKAEMALSSYDTNKDGMCDGAQCNVGEVKVDDDAGLIAAANEFGTELASIGIQATFAGADPNDVYNANTDPTTHSPLYFAFGWAADYFSGFSWFGPLALGANIGNTNPNTSLIGATSDQLKSWGYSVTNVPGLDAQINDCAQQTGSAQFECWARTDQYMMERVVSWIPLDSSSRSRLTSSNVVAFDFDASLAMPSLSEIQVQH